MVNPCQSNVNPFLSTPLWEKQPVPRRDKSCSSCRTAAINGHKQCLNCIVLLQTVQLCKWGCPFFFSGETAGGCRRQLKNTAVAVLIFLMDDYGWPSILKADWSPLRYSLHATFLEARPSPWRKIACLTRRMSPLENISTSCSTPCG